MEVSKEKAIGAESGAESTERKITMVGNKLVSIQTVVLKTAHNQGEKIELAKKWNEDTIARMLKKRSQKLGIRIEDMI
jgi:hypothetical protein